MPHTLETLSKNFDCHRHYQ